MKRCGHVWSTISFIGNPFGNYWNCEIAERCDLCNKDRKRQARSEEVEVEIRRLTCECGFLHADHENGAGHCGSSCIKLLTAKVRDLEERLHSLEAWRVY